MTSILHSNIASTSDSESAFFPVPDSMRQRSERRRMMVQDLISSAFTGVPRGFYRAYAMSSPLQLVPTSVQDTPAEGQATAQFQAQSEAREINRVENAEPAFEPEEAPMSRMQKYAAEGQRYVTREGRQGSDYGRGKRNKQ